MIGLAETVRGLSELAELARDIILIHEVILYARWNWFLHSLSTET